MHIYTPLTEQVTCKVAIAYTKHRKSLLLLKACAECRMKWIKCSPVTLYTLSHTTHEWTYDGIAN
uniref:Uncharacterized protein n=1 Tax=Anguilla anguilla TaxID=7936 RepID=A0A0E9WMG1_ANGAN